MSEDAHIARFFESLDLEDGDESSAICDCGDCGYTFVIQREESTIHIELHRPVEDLHGNVEYDVPWAESMDVEEVDGMYWRFGSSDRFSVSRTDEDHFVIDATVHE